MVIIQVLLSLLSTFHKLLTAKNSTHLSEKGEFEIQSQWFLEKNTQGKRTKSN